MASVFFSYSHADEALRDQLEKQLAMLKRQGVIETWHDRRIGAGQDWRAAITAHTEEDDIILLLVSPDFLASDYCYDIEMTRAMERHRAGQAVVIPVILRACDWHGALFGALLATPPDGRPVTQWPDRDQAFLEVTKAIRTAVSRFSAPTLPTAEAPRRLSAQRLSGPSPARSSNLRVTKQFADRDKDAFRLEAFDYIAKYFENSLAELSARNPGIEGAFRRIDADRFTATAYRHGRAVTRCTIFTGGGTLLNGIAYSVSESHANAFNECLSVHTDDQSLFLQGLGMATFGRGRSVDTKLTLEGAAERYWSLFIEPLQRP